MRRLLAFVWLLLALTYVPVQAMVSLKPIQDKAFDAWTSGASITVTLASTPINGNALVIAYGCNTPSNLQVSSITQTGATWARVIRSNTARTSDIWMASNVAGAGTSVTINLSTTPANSTTQAAEISEWSGLLTAAAATPTTSSNTGTTTSPLSGTITPSVNREALIIAGIYSQNTLTAGPTGFTALVAASTKNAPGYQLAAVASGSTYSTGWTQSSGSYDATIAALYGNGRVPAPFFHR